jgi:hypothetical protein
MYFDDTPYSVQNAGETYSYKQTGEVYRFEVHSGDQWRAQDGAKERSEISAKQTLAFDKTYTMSYDFMVEPGQKNTAQWLNIGQFHGTPDAGDYGSLGPVFAIQLNGERMQLITRTDPDRISEGRPEDNVLYTDSTDIVRGQWYHLDIQIRFDPDGKGLIDVTRDGKLLAHYEGGVGYNDATGPYWKMGIYREASPETLAVDYRNFNLVEDAIDKPSGGSPAPVPTDPAPTDPQPGQGATDKPLQLRASNNGDSLTGQDADDRLVGGRGADTLNGSAGEDRIQGGAGNDVLNGGSGADTIGGGDNNDYLRGGDGADVLKGNDGADTLVGDAGADTMTGGSGFDVFRFEKLDGSVDVISEFSRNDKIDLRAIGVGSDTVFVNGLGATAAGHPAIHYVQSEGALYLDTNGGSAADAVQIAVLSNHFNLSASSFLLA